MKNTIISLGVKNFIQKIIATSLLVQIVPAIGYLVALVVSYFYLFINDPRFPKERPEILWLGFGLSAFSFVVGKYVADYRREKIFDINFKEGSLIIVFTWLFACSISALVFVYAGFPVPANSSNYTFIEQFIDGLFESMSGFTTTGASVLPSVEVFPRGLLMWRSLTHWIGGMGIAYLAISIFKKLAVKRGNIINAEAETPNIVEFETESDALSSGRDFLKIYSLMSLILFILLIISGALFRAAPYEKWYDNLFDAVIHTFGTLGTGGFSNYNSSVGLPVVAGGSIIQGGLQNKVSEWIIAFFMFLAGANFSLWYILFFSTKNWKDLFRNLELQVYTGLVAFVTFGITFVLTISKSGDVLDNLRYAFFNVTNILSTTGFGNTDFTQWPAIAQGFLFICYLVGGMVGSTAGGLKVIRFIILSKFSLVEIKGLITGKFTDGFTVDGIKYTNRSAALVLINTVLYYMLFLVGGILIMATSPVVTFVDGTIKNIDFSSAFTASIATLGNIGPAIAVGSVDAGPNGNYYAYSELAKILMTILMFIGRVGILSVMILFISDRGQEKIEDSIAEVEFDKDHPTLRA